CTTCYYDYPWFAYW
nr:immunoglobulin heavy chain junction region [Mus musculus]